MKELSISKLIATLSGKKVQCGEICTPYIKSIDQVADGLTKGVTQAQLKDMLNKWGCHDIYTPLERE